ncbi:MAG TPA: aminotransferase class I/II-fold pyridoxal phosphate-dependent enzyme [Fimbriimonadaceae bacterium]|jgi:cystathionine beta-lyase/cystathionine gamma-synthase
MKLGGILFKSVEDKTPPSIDTDLQHFAEDTKILGAVVPPIFQNSLFVFDTYEEFSSGMAGLSKDQEKYYYSRISNPSMAVAEKKIAHLEHTDRAKVFGSGMAAVSCAIMSCVHQDAHVVAVDTCYSNTRQMLQDYLPKFGVKSTFVEGSCSEEVIDNFTPETKLIVLESPSTFFFKLQDLETICKAAKAKKITTMIDNSYSTPIFQTPADFGVDLIVHSATKYLAGHSDITAGVICGPESHMANLIQNEVVIYGSALAPFPAWLLTRGMRTLKLRMKQHELAGNFVAEYLQDSPLVDRVHHVGLASFPQKDLYRKQMSGSGGLISFEPKFQTLEEVTRFINALELFQIGVSWGGFESLVVGAVSQPLGYQEKRWVIRLYCGLEGPEDLVADLETAFKMVGE